MAHAALGIAQHDHAAHQRGGQRAALNGRHHGLAAALLDGGNHIGGHQLAGHDMVGQHRRQRGLVFRLQQIGDSAGRQLGKGGVVRGEHGERAFALQRINQAGSLHGSNQRGEIGRAGSGINNVGDRLRVNGGRGQQASSGNGKQRSAHGSAREHGGLRQSGAPPEQAGASLQQGGGPRRLSQCRCDEMGLSGAGLRPPTICPWRSPARWARRWANRRQARSRSPAPRPP